MIAIRETQDTTNSRKITRDTGRAREIATKLNIRMKWETAMATCVISIAGKFQKGAGALCGSKVLTVAETFSIRVLNACTQLVTINNGLILQHWKKKMCCAFVADRCNPPK